MAEEKKVGTVSIYFDHIGVAGIDVTATLRVGDLLHIKGANTDIELEVNSMQKDGEQIEEASGGDEVGVKLEEGQKIEVGDEVFLAN